MHTCATLPIRSYYSQPDRVSDFCKRNKLQLIIRAHECVMDGFERFAQGQLITLFSATNYCGKLISGQFLSMFWCLQSHMAFSCRDGKQCWCYTGCWQRLGCGSKINSSFATASSVTGDISGTGHRGHMDAGKPFSIMLLVRNMYYLIVNLKICHQPLSYSCIFLMSCRS